MIRRCVNLTDICAKHNLMILNFFLKINYYEFNDLLRFRSSDGAGLKSKRNRNTSKK